MAVFALTSTTVTLNGSAITGDLKSATLAVDAAQLDTTDFASGGWVEMIGGLKSGTLTLEFQDDLADDALASGSGSEEGVDRALPTVGHGPGAGGGIGCGFGHGARGDRAGFGGGERAFE